MEEVVTVLFANFDNVVAVAQLVERRVVVPNVVGSSPISHPTHLFIEGECLQ